MSTYSLKSKAEKLKQNSAASYYDKFAVIVQQAFLDKYLTEDYTIRVSRISNVETFRQIIDDEELKLLLENLLMMKQYLSHPYLLYYPDSGLVL